VITLLAAAMVAVASYWAGRVRLGRWLLSWAEDRNGGSHGPAWWAAQSVGLVAVAWMLTVHPHRTAANRRSWREARRAPAPTFDSQWIRKRGDDA
jgi:hypothetical protein